ncbi:MAG TPA: Hint domain-containing protein [Acetobacteraceae bacterium]
MTDRISGPPMGSFAAGTRIAVPGPDATPRMCPIEELQQGDVVLVSIGEAQSPRPIRRITRRRIDAASHPAPLRAAPIRLRAGALGPETPQCDILVPQEALLRFSFDASPARMNDVLVPAGALVNGISILREPTAGVTSWYTLELYSHNVVLAEGAPAASFRGGGAASEGARMPLCLRLLSTGAPLLGLRSRLAEHAVRMQAAIPGFDHLTPGLGDDSGPTLRLFANGEELDALYGSTQTERIFTLPPGTGKVRLISRAYDSPAPDDPRRMGVCVVGLAVDGEALALEGPVPGRGFHAVEGDQRRRWRWTDGNAWLALPHRDATRELTIRITDWHRVLQPAN